MSRSKQSLSYKQAGVDIERGDALVEVIKPLAKSTYREGCLTDVGGFGALFEVPKRFSNPILVSGTDGVGTKLKLAFQFERHHTIGIDLVAMCANDILTQGAEPLFFLDYFATGKLDSDQAAAVLQGIAAGCRQAGAALIGGETAEMPGMYASGEYDLAGFCVGVVERERILDGSNIESGDIVLGLPSSGPHANGYSLIRRVISTCGIDMNAKIDGAPLPDVLLSPTRIYVKPILSLLQDVTVHGIAHITGGGLPGNLQRILGSDKSARLNPAAWTWPGIFSWLQQMGNIESEEMYRAFNCGIGLVVVLAPSFVEKAIQHLKLAGQQALVIGEIVPRESGPQVSIK